MSSYPDPPPYKGPDPGYILILVALLVAVTVVLMLT
jgi:hypothetical protein